MIHDMLEFQRIARKYRSGISTRLPLGVNAGHIAGIQREQVRAANACGRQLGGGIRDHAISKHHAQRTPAVFWGASSPEPLGTVRGGAIRSAVSMDVSTTFSPT